MEIHVLPDRVVIVLWISEPIATVYYQSDIIQSFKKQFDMLWHLAKD